MSSFSKGSKRILSLLMSIVMFVCTYLAAPASALADELELKAAAEEYSRVNDFSGDTSMKYSSLLGEQEDKRSENTRSFRRADGMIETVLYADSIAYETEDGYALIDNTLEKTEYGYTNRASDLRITFGYSTESGYSVESGYGAEKKDEDMVKLEAGGNRLSFYLGGFYFSEDFFSSNEAETEIIDTEEETPEPETVEDDPAEIFEPESTDEVDTATEEITEDTSEDATDEPDDADVPADIVEEQPSEENTNENSIAEDSSETGPEETVPTENENPEDESIEDNMDTESSAEDDTYTEDNVEEDVPGEENAEEEIRLEEEDVLFERLKNLKRPSAEIRVKNHERGEEPETRTFEARELEGEDADMQLRFPPQLTSEAEYTDDDLGVSLRYVLSGKDISEYVTLARYPGEGFYYVSVISWKGDIEEEEDGTYLFIDSQGEMAFRLGLPYMEDAWGEVSDSIRTTLEPAGEDKWLYTVMPDEDWMKTAAYPVTIDPDFSANFRSNVTDTYIDPNAVNTKHGTNTTLSCFVSGTMILLKIADEAFPTLSSGDAVTYAALHMAKSNTDSSHLNACVGGHAVTSSWDNDTTYTNRPTYEGAVLTAGVSSKRYTYTEFDITNLVRDWYAGTRENHGILLKCASSASTAFYSSESSTVNYKPYFSIVYRNSTGLENTWTYYSQNAGRAGTGSVNLFSGNLTWIHVDAGITNGAMGVSINHVYNANDKDTDIGYGNGWRLNYAQELVKEEISTTTGDTTYYRLTDGDGTRHWYKHDTGSKYVNELNKDTTLTIHDDHTAMLKDKGDATMTFALDGSDAWGRLTEIADAAGNKTLIVYTSNTTDTDGNLTETAVRDLRVASVQEALNGQTEGQSVSFSYNTENRLSKITPPDGLETEYTYTDGNLSSITYKDSKTAFYTYNDTNLLTSAKNIDDYNLNYVYTASAPCQVIKVTEKADSTVGQHLDFAYSRQKTIVTDSQGRDTIYTLNYIGQSVSVTDSGDRAVYAAYKTADREVTQLKAVSKTQDTVYNLLVNHGFEKSSSSLKEWTANKAVADSSVKHSGRRSAKLSAGGSISEKTAVVNGETYTFSAWVKGKGVTLSVGNATSAVSTSTEWERIHVTFTATESTVTARIGSTATAYVDDVQLEKGRVPSRYNLVENSSFDKNLTGWSVNYSAVNGTGTDERFGKVGKLCQAQKKNTLEQAIPYSGSAGDTYSVGVWIKCNDYPASTQEFWYQQSSAWKTHKEWLGKKQVRLEFLNSSGTVLESVGRDLTPGATGWQFISFSAVPTRSYSSMNIKVEYGFALDTMLIDGVQVFREEFSQGYTYDTNGNLKSYTSLIGQQDSFDYDDHDNMISSTDPRGNTTTYTYDDHHNLLTSTSPEGVVTSNTYNDFGLPTETRVGTDTNYIRSTTAYDNASGIAISETDALGNATTYTLDSTLRTRTAITDARNSITTYTYGSPADYGRLQSITTTGLNPVAYSYTSNGEIQTISRGGTSYNYSYDIWGRSRGLTVGASSLSTNVFNDAGLLAGVEYGNGFAVEYEYDNLDRLVAVKTKPADSDTYSTAYEYIYNGNGELYEERNYLTNRALLHEYDHSGRCVASVEKTFTGSSASLTYGTAVSTYLYHYDVNNNISRIQQSIAGSSWNMVYTYDKDNRGLTTTIGNDIVFTNSYDAIGRIQSKQIGLSTPYSIAVSYKNGVNGSSSVLLDTYRNGADDAYSYTYDANNNILSVAQGEASSSYVYDAANQLVRANIYNSNTDNYTATYTYDGNGNITAKSIYPYTIGELGTATSTIQYGYETAGWTDQLTSYNGQSIVYDASGNPTTYLGQSLSWNGLQLTGVGGNISYSYDKDGIRQTKTVGTAITQYYYNGNVLMGTYDGTNKLLFSYNEQSNVVAVNYNGTYYYYLRDGQGNIIKLIDGNGATVVSYSYDPWGACTTSGTMASTLGTLNPFRYHGYVYDEETGWYYLSSRYYNPEVGRYLSADTLSSTGQGVLGYNMYAYCLNNPTTNYDPSGSLSFSNLLSGAKLLSVGLTAVAVGLTVLTCGAAAPVMVAVAAVTVTTGAVTVANGLAEVQEGLTASSEGAQDGTNFMRDGLMQGNKEAYECQRDVIATVAEVGTFICTAYTGLKGGVCFAAGTLVLTETGQAPIEIITEGEYVYATDPETGESGYKQVVQTFVNETNELVHVKTDGDEIVCTREHPFYVPVRGWTAACDLRAGDILVRSNGEYVVVEAIEHELLESPITVYNFEVEDFHTYHVGSASVLVHNKCHGNSLKTNRKTELYALRQNNTNKVMKIGETTRGIRRYTKSFYETNDVYMQILDAGSKYKMHYQQHRILKKFFDVTGALPSINKSLW